jgi:hypothetical protein
MKLRALPTWILTNAITPFLCKGHPWRWRWFQLDDWHAGQTELCRKFDYALWWSGAYSLAVLIIVLIILSS